MKTKRAIIENGKTSWIWVNGWKAIWMDFQGMLKMWQGRKVNKDGYFVEYNESWKIRMGWKIDDFGYWLGDVKLILVKSIIDKLSDGIKYSILDYMIDELDEFEKGMGSDEFGIEDIKITNNKWKDEKGESDLLNYLIINSEEMYL